MNPAAHAYTHWISGALDRGKNTLEAAQEKMTRYADTRMTTPPAYEAGNAVMLSVDHGSNCGGSPWFLGTPHQMFSNFCSN